MKKNFIILLIIALASLKAGTGILFSLHNLNNRQLFKINEDGSGEKMLLDLKNWKGDYTFDTQTKNVYYTDYGIYRFSPDVSPVKTTLVYRCKNSPVFSFDLTDDSIIFAAGCETESSRNLIQLFSVDKNGQNLKKITDSTKNCSFPRWIRGTDKILFISYPESESGFTKENPALCQTVDLKSGIIETICSLNFRDEWEIYGIGVSPDGKVAAVVDMMPETDERAVYLIDILAKNSRILIPGNENIHFSGYCDFSADSKRLIFSMKEGETGNFRLCSFDSCGCGLTVKVLFDKNADVSHPRCYYTER